MVGATLLMMVQNTAARPWLAHNRRGRIRPVVVLVSALGAYLSLSACGRISFESHSRDSGADTGVDTGAPSDGGIDAPADSSPPSDAGPDSGSDAAFPDGGARPVDCPPAPEPCHDPSFGGPTGSSILDLGTLTDPGYLIDGIAAHGDGFLVVGATGTDTDRDFVVVRLDRSGQVDTSFGTGGRRVVDLGPEDSSHSVTTLGDGTIFVSGDSAGAAYVLKLDRTGDLVPAFGIGGIAAADFATALESANGIAVLDDGRVVVGGQGFAAVGGAIDLTAARLLADGSGLDPTFGTSGAYAHDFTTSDEFGTLRAGRGGEFILSGSSYAGADSFDCALVRVTAAGAHAASARHDVAGGSDSCGAAAVHPGGGYVGAGSATRADTDHALFRVREDLSLDPTFGAGGYAVVDAGGTDQGRALAVLPDGRIVVGGWLEAGADDIATLWVVGSDGSYLPSDLIRIDVGDVGGSQRIVSLLTDTPTSVLALFVEARAAGARLIVQRYIF